MEIWQHKSAIVSHLKIRSSEPDQTALRLRFERLFANHDWQPNALAPRAILCVRHLRDPQPHTLRLNGGDVRRTIAWQNRVAAEINRLANRAARPIRETVLSTAETIVFEDYAELLACLASDWAEDLLSVNWWWKSLFPDFARAGTVARLWFEQSEYAPQAIALLAARNRAAAFARRLDARETKTLLHKIVRQFGLTKIETALDETQNTAKSDFRAQTANSIFETKLFAKNPTAPLAESSNYLLPKTDLANLNFDQQVLLAVGLELVRRPAFARSADFAGQIKTRREQFRDAATRNSEKPVYERTTDFARKSFASKNGELTDKSNQISFGKAVPDLKIKENLKSAAQNVESEITQPELQPMRETAVSTDSKKAQPPNLKSVSPANSVTKMQPEPAQTNVEQTQKVVQPSAAKPPPQTFEIETPAGETAADTDFEIFETAPETFATEFAGVFYLLNLGLFLGLYSDFTNSNESEIELNIWDFVRRVGRELLAETVDTKAVTPQKIEDDAVWKWLAGQAGRQPDEVVGNETTGAQFPNVFEWQMPREWLATFQTAENWLWTQIENRLIVWHPAGFCVYDGAKTLANVLEFYGENVSGAIESEFQKINKINVPPAATWFEFWLRHFVVYARCRLRQALDLPPENSLSAVLIERQAQIQATATHLDVTFNLADLPVAVRLAGLDRNPNWIPAAGKFVAFHFV